MRGVSESALLDVEQGNAWPCVASAEGPLRRPGSKSRPRVNLGISSGKGAPETRERAMTPRQVAEYGGLRPRTFYDRTAAGDLPRSPGPGHIALVLDGPQRTPAATQRGRALTLERLSADTYSEPLSQRRRIGRPR